MKIEGSENIRGIFGIFHDGTIARIAHDGDDLILEVEIEYFAKRVESCFTKFFVRLGKSKIFAL